MHRTEPVHAATSLKRPAAHADGLAVTAAEASLLPLYLAAGLACLHAARGRVWRLTWLLFGVGALMLAATFGLAIAGGPTAGTRLVATGALAAASLAVLRALLPDARREVVFDGAMLGLGGLTVWGGFVVIPALDEPWPRVAALALLALSGAALNFAAACSFGTKDRSANPAVLRLCAGHAALLLPAVGGFGPVVHFLLLATAAVALLAAVDRRPREETLVDPEDDGAEAPLRRHLAAPVACMAIFPGSLAALLVVRAPSPLEVAVWGATWSLAGLLIFARQNWLMGDRHRAVARERDLRREMVRRNAELAALTDLASAVTQMRDERSLVDRGLQVLLRVADARGVDIELAGVRHALPADAPSIAQEGDPHALSLPLIVRDEQLGTVSLGSRGGPFDPESARLVGLLANQLAVGLSHIRDYNEKSDQALRDPLTGIYNRRVLQDALDRALLSAARENGHVGLTLFDIDDFKAINDVHGHDVGDEVLRRVAACGRQVVRPGDTFARIGGEEFALLTPGAGTEEALLIAERLRLAVAALDVLPDRSVTVSAGLASWPVDATDGDALRRAADEALYRAKAAGKNRVELAGGAPSLA
jgi:diguanylate cyclase (GGDEF)-like protein